eukprot:scaffold412_cov311-Pavlova_lutheri.AAC.24
MGRSFFGKFFTHDERVHPPGRPDLGVGFPDDLFDGSFQWLERVAVRPLCMRRGRARIVAPPRAGHQFQIGFWGPSIGPFSILVVFVLVFWAAHPFAGDHVPSSYASHVPVTIAHHKIVPAPSPSQPQLCPCQCISWRGLNTVHYEYVGEPSTRPFHLCACHFRIQCTHATNKYLAFLDAKHRLDALAQCTIAIALTWLIATVQGRPSDTSRLHSRSSHESFEPRGTRRASRTRTDRRRDAGSFHDAQGDRIVAHVRERHQESVSTHADHQRHPELARMEKEARVPASKHPGWRQQVHPSENQDEYPPVNRKRGRRQEEKEGASITEPGDRSLRRLHPGSTSAKSLGLPGTRWAIRSESSKNLAARVHRGRSKVQGPRGELDGPLRSFPVDLLKWGLGCTDAQPDLEGVPVLLHVFDLARVENGKFGPDPGLGVRVEDGVHSTAFEHGNHVFAKAFLGS